MINRYYFSGFTKILILVIGILSVSSPIFEQILQNNFESRNIASQNQDQDQDKESGNELIVPAFQATISSFHIDLDSYPKFLPDIPVIALIKSYVRQVFNLTSYSFYRTLFRNIISPNAP